MKLIFSRSLILIFISIITTSIANPDDSTTKKPSDSTEFNPNITAAEFLGDMNLTAKPCDNFYEFVCGNYMASDNSMRSRKSDFMDQARDDLENILTETSPPGEIQALKNVRNFYRSCNNATEPARENDLHTLKDILHELGGWPMLEGSHWREDKFNWSSFIVQLGAIDSNVFFRSTCRSSSHCELKPRESIFNHEQLTNKTHDPIVNAYFQNLKKYITKFGGNSEIIQREFFEELIHFDEAISQLFQSLTTSTSNLPVQFAHLFSRSQYKILLTDLTKQYPWIPFNEYLLAFMQFTSRQISIRSDCSIETYPHFIDKLIKLVNETSKRTLANYALMRLVMSNTPTEVIKKTHYGFASSKPTACFNFMEETLHLARDAIFVRKYFSNNTKNKTIQLITDIKAQTKEELKKIDSLSNETIQSLLTTIEGIKVAFGYPDEFFIDEEIQKYYQGLVIKDDDFVQGYYELYLYSLRTFNQSKRLDLYRNWLDYTSLILLKPLELPLLPDHIRVSASFLHGSFFHSDQPNYLNYAGAGEYVGTTLGIMSSSVINNIKELLTQKLDKLHCKQFHTGKILFNEELKTKKKTLEDYFEHLGMNIAYSAYENWLSRSKIVEPKLPGMNYTSEQMFWINVMHQKCSKGSLRSRNDNINDLVNVMDSSGFRDAFNCPNALENPVCPAIESIGN